MNMHAQPVALAVMGRTPVLGQVKSRLAAVLGPERTLAAYQQLLSQTMAMARRSGMAVHFFASDASQPAIETLARRYGHRLREQGDGDLGERMASAFNDLLASYRRVVMIGTDCPALDPALLWHLAGAARQGTAFVAAEDGGYVALASDRASPWQAASMPGIRFGSEFALADTCRWLHGQGEAVTICGRSWDVDDVHDWLRWRINRRCALDMTQDGRPRMTDADNLDRALVSELKDVMGDDFPALVASFRQDGERRIAVMRDALQCGDMESLRATAHSFKGSSGNVGAVQVAAACLAMENAAQAGDSAAAAAVLGDLSERFEAALLALAD